jgi:two-component SAPR family response regulator
VSLVTTVEYVIDVYTHEENGALPCSRVDQGATAVATVEKMRSDLAAPDTNLPSMNGINMA